MTKKICVAVNFTFFHGVVRKTHSILAKISWNQFICLRNYVDLTKYCFGESKFLIFPQRSVQRGKVVKNTITVFMKKSQSTFFPIFPSNQILTEYCIEFTKELPRLISLKCLSVIVFYRTFLHCVSQKGDFTIYSLEHFESLRRVKFCDFYNSPFGFSICTDVLFT